jgi:hypothetical protein
MKIQRIFAVCLFLAAAGVSRAYTEEPQYSAVFMEGKKVGYAIQSRVVADGKVTTTEEMRMQLSRDGVIVSVGMTDTSIETVEGEPLGFEIMQDLGMVKMHISGKVDKQGKVSMVITSMAGDQKISFSWPNGAVMAEGLRLLQLRKGLKEGLEYNVKLFSPGSVQAIEAEVQIGPKQNVDLLGRVVALTEVRTTLNLSGNGGMVSIAYVDDEFCVQKSIAPVMGMQIEMVACTKEFALSESDTLELIDKMFLASPKPLENIESAKSAVYHLMPTGEEVELTIPSSDNQSVRHIEGGEIIVTVKPAVAKAGARFPYDGEDGGILDAMKPTRFLQSDNSSIIGLAKRAVGDTKDAAEAVKKIEAFVYEYIERRSLSVGYASAAEVAASREGDCSEFAVLTVAMCRAVGIPARVVFGLVYTEDFAGRANVFVGHAWAEAYVGDKWIGLDATKRAGGFGPGHLALATGNGEPIDFFGMVSTLGYFDIKDVVIER